MSKILLMIGFFLIIVGILFVLLPIFIALNDYIKKVDQEKSLKRHKFEFIIGIVLVVIGIILQIFFWIPEDLIVEFRKFLKIDFLNIVHSIIISIISSFIFWILTFKISRTDVIFSKMLVKPYDTLTNNRKNYGYRVRYANIGHRDLIELSIYAKLVIHGSERNHIFFLDVSRSSKDAFVTILSRLSFKNRKEGNYCRTMTLYPSESMQNELTKIKYSENIRQIANNDVINFKDIFDEYGENVTIEIYVYGNDKTTGARRAFKSKCYTMYDIEEGDFYGIKELNVPIWGSKKVKQDKISQIHKKICV